VPPSDVYDAGRFSARFSNAYQFGIQTRALPFERSVSSRWGNGGMVASPEKRAKCIMHRRHRMYALSSDNGLIIITLVASRDVIDNSRGAGTARL